MCQHLVSWVSTITDITAHLEPKVLTHFGTVDELVASAVTLGETVDFIISCLDTHLHCSDTKRAVEDQCTRSDHLGMIFHTDLDSAAWSSLVDLDLLWNDDVSTDR